MGCDVHIRKSLYAECRVVSGTATFQEVLELMVKELTASAPSAMKTKWFAPTDGTPNFRYAEVLFQPRFQQQNPRRLFQSDMEWDDFFRKNMCVDACCSAELTATSPSAMKINVVAPRTMSSALLLPKFNELLLLTRPTLPCAGSVRGGSHTARSGQEPYTPGGTDVVLRVGGIPRKTVGPTL